MPQQGSTSKKNTRHPFMARLSIRKWKSPNTQPTAKRLALHVHNSRRSDTA